MCLPVLSSLPTLVQSEICCLRHGTTRSGLDLPTAVNTSKITPSDMSTSQSDLDGPPLRLSSRVILDCAMLTTEGIARPRNRRSKKQL